MAFTLIARELFQSVGTITSGSPGAFTGTITGTWYKRPVGPRISTIAAPGWSADGRRANCEALFNLTGGSDAAGYIGAWYFLTPAWVYDGSAPPRILLLNDTSANNVLFLRFNPSNVKWDFIDNSVGGGTTTLDSVQYYHWYYWAIAWTFAANTLSWRLYQRIDNGPFTNVASRSANYLTAPMGKAGIGTSRLGAGSFIDGRIGSAALYALTTLDDSIYPSDLIAPVRERHTWYVNPSTGNDNNDGLSATTAWQTAAKLAAEVLYCGTLGTDEPWCYTDSSSAAGAITTAWLAGVKAGTIVPNGDRVLINTSAASFPLTQAIQVSSGQRGLEIGSATTTAADLRVFKAIASPYTQYDSINYPNIWTSTDTQTSVVLWEDRKWLNAPFGSTITAVRTSLNATAGSFWTDGTTLYFHPFGSTNPNTDGKVYERSRLLDTSDPATVTAAAVRYLNTPDVYAHDLKVGGYCLSRNTDGNPYAAYCFGGQCSGRSFVRDLELYYGSNHCLGWIGSDDGTIRLNLRVNAYQCSVYAGSGGSTVYVEYEGTTPAGTREHYYDTCTCTAVIGLLGSTAGQAYSSSVAASQNEAWYTHNSSVGTGQFAKVQITDCNFIGGPIGANEATVASGGLTITGTTAYRITTTSPLPSIQRCKTTKGLIRMTVGGTARNCLMILDEHSPGGTVANVAGTISYLNCTWDARLTVNTTERAGLLKRNGTTAITFKNNAIWLNTSALQPTTIIQDLVSGEVAVWDGNIYVLAAGNYIAKNYSGADKTFTQWQALGFDTAAGTRVVSSLLLNSDLTPQTGSPVINIALDVGPLADYSGSVWVVRNDAGAYEAGGIATDIEEALVSFLKSTPEVTAIIGVGVQARIYPEAAPQDVTDDHLTYQMITDRREGHLAGRIAMSHARIQVDAWCKPNKPAKTLALAVQRANGGVTTGRELDGFSGEWDGVKVHRCIIEDRRGDPVPPAHGEESPYRRRSMDLLVDYDIP